MYVRTSLYVVDPFVMCDTMISVSSIQCEEQNEGIDELSRNICYVLKAMTFPADYPTITVTNENTPYYVLFFVFGMSSYSSLLCLVSVE